MDEDQFGNFHLFYRYFQYNLWKIRQKQEYKEKEFFKNLFNLKVATIVFTLLFILSHN